MRNFGHLDAPHCTLFDTKLIMECWTTYQREYDRAKRASRTAEQEAGQQAISRRYYEKHKEQVKAKSTRQDLLRRERFLHVQTEQIHAHEIFERDNWVCQLCGDPVDQTLKFPHPMSKSLDHTLPVSLFGSHTGANLQLAHLKCNLKKGGRGGGDRKTSALEEV